MAAKANKNPQLIPKKITDRLINPLYMSRDRNAPDIRYLLQNLTDYYNQNQDLILNPGLVYSVGSNPEIYDQIRALVLLLSDNKIITDKAKRYVDRILLSSTDPQIQAYLDDLIQADDAELALLIYLYINGNEVEIPENYYKFIEDLENNSKIKSFMRELPPIYAFMDLYRRYKLLSEIYSAVSTKEESPEVLQYLHDLAILSRQDANFKNALVSWISRLYSNPELLNRPEDLRYNTFGEHAEVMENFGQAILDYPPLLLRFWELIPALSTDEQEIRSRNDIINYIEDNPYKVEFKMYPVRCYSCPTPLSQINPRDVIRSLYQSNSPAIRDILQNINQRRKRLPPKLGTLIAMNTRSKAERDQFFTDYVTERVNAEDPDSVPDYFDRFDADAKKYRLAKRADRSYRECCVMRLLAPTVYYRQSQKERELQGVVATTTKPTGIKAVSLSKKRDENEDINRMMGEIVEKFRTTGIADVPGVYTR